MARIRIRVQPGAKQVRVSLMDDGTYKLSVKARAVDGSANRAVCEALALLMSASKRDVRIISGETSRTKTIEIVGLEASVLHDILSRHVSDDA